MTARITARNFEDNYTRGPGCWLWKGARLNGKGYGSFFGKIASRIAYERRHGAIPFGYSVLHSCDTPACVNPEHLHLGTNADNVREKCERGRQYRPLGSLNPMLGKKPASITKLRACEVCGSVVTLTTHGRYHGQNCRKEVR